jgi:hypothetical protein
LNDDGQRRSSRSKPLAKPLGGEATCSWTFLSKINKRSEKAGKTEINGQLFETECNGQLLGNIQQRSAAVTARSENIARYGQNGKIKAIQRRANGAESNTGEMNKKFKETSVD